MIGASLNLLARAIPLGDAAILQHLMERLLDDTAAVRPGSATWIRDVSRTSIESRYARRFRENDLDAATRRIHRGQSHPVSLDWLDPLFEDYFHFDGDHIAARPTRRIGYSRLCAKLHPSMVVAWRLSGLLQSDLSMTDVERLIGNAAPSFLPDAKDTRQWADMHVHLGGSQDSALALFTLALGSKRLNGHEDHPSHDHRNGDARPMRNLLACFSTLFATLLTRMLQPASPEDPVWLSKADLRHAWELGSSTCSPIQPGAWLKLHQVAPQGGAQLAYRAMEAFEDGDVHAAWLYWLTSLCVFYRGAKLIVERDAVLAFLNLAHLLRNDMIHDGAGLSRFVRYFSSPVRKAAGSRDRDAAGLKHLLGADQSFAEIKFSPGDVAPGKAESLLSQASRLLYRPVRTERADAVRRTTRRMHMCIHFVRDNGGTGNDGAGGSAVRFRSLRYRSFDGARQIDAFLRRSSLRFAVVDGARLDLSGLVRCLDVAGDEVDGPIEAFAPALRWLRRTPIRSHAAAPATVRRGLILSVHAGEDFGHPYSGMRKIDETVTFCDFGVNDRLGHALALGIRPQHWWEQQESFITCEEHLDNLVWAWHHACLLSAHWRDAAAVAMRLEHRIRIYAPIVYGKTFARLDPHDLFRAWQLRRNCPVHLRMEGRNHGGAHRRTHWVPDIDVLNDQEAVAGRLYSYYHRMLRRPPADRRTAPGNNDIVLIRQGEHLPSAERPLEDWMSALEIEFTEALQDYLMTQYAERGIVIEANPSSNVYVGRIDDYHQHPIFRWHPPVESVLDAGKQFNRFGLRKGIVPVCVNTDDPGIFPTTLQNEFCLLQEAAQHHAGASLTQAKQWIDTLRIFGVNLFASAHVVMDR